MTEEEEKPKKRKQPTLWQTYKHYAKEMPPLRWCVRLVAVCVIIIFTLNIYNAVVVYDDWRCLTADCKILKGGDKEWLLIADDEL